MPQIFKTAAGEQAVKARYAEMLALWPVPRTELRLATSQGETFAIASGPADAPPLVLLHGSAANSASWMGDVAAWATTFRVHAVDLIGEPGFSAPSRPSLATDAHARWLAEVLDGLGVGRTALLGLSLGGWMALDFATRHSERVERLVLLCPGGVGRHRNVLLWAAPLLLLGRWGRRKVLERIGGPVTAADAPPEVRAFGEFMGLIFRHFRPRTERLPRFTDEALRRLTMPVLAVLGGRDAFIDSEGTRARLEANAPDVRVRWLPEAGHFLPGQTQAVLEFLTCSG